jgi:DNA-binding NtrC family response regulator
MKVLIADDDEVLVQLLSVGLKKRGIDSVTAFDTMQAVMSAMRGSDMGAVECIEKPIDLDRLAEPPKSLVEG